MLDEHLREKVGRVGCNKHRDDLAVRWHSLEYSRALVERDDVIRNPRYDHMNC